MLEFAKRCVVAAAIAAFTAAVVPVESGVASVSHTQITGTGSSWAANALNQWIASGNQLGLQVVFTSTGSAQGRKDFAYKTTDFGVSDIAYQGVDPITNDADTSLGRKYAYIPIVAGGTAFPYNLHIAGHRVANLRLSGSTIAGIFTNKITYWDDPAIKADNNNKLPLPHEKIIPVVHSEGSGSTFQFTAYLAKEFHSEWASFQPGGRGLPTEYFPRQGSQQAQNGSDGVMNFIESAAGEGSIGFDEYSYALLAGFPVAKVLNSAGYYTAPTQYNVAVALTQAQIDTKDVNDPTKYLTQNLSHVYTYNDKRTYPLSSYSYMIIPISPTDSKTSSTAQRQTLADFLSHSICEWQAGIGPIGYSPLPLYLVQAGFQQIKLLQLPDHSVDLTIADPRKCNNPTFDPNSPSLNNNRLAKIAPEPPACDQQGAGPCAAGVGVFTGNPNSNGHVPSGGSTNPAGSSNTPGPGGSSAPPGGSGGPTPGGGQTTTDANGNPVVVGPGGTTTPGVTGLDASQILGVANTVPATQSTAAFSTVMYILCALLLVALIAGPVLAAQFFRRRARPDAT